MATPTNDTYTAAAGEVIYAGQHAPGQLVPVAKYRFQQPLLFHRAHERIHTASYVNSLGQTVLVPSMDHGFCGYDGFHDFSATTKCGSTTTLVCCISAWGWKHNGGDWLDNSMPSRLEQGPMPWATFPAIPNGAPPGEISVDLTDLIAYCDQQQRWYGLMIHVSGGQLRIHGPLNSGDKSVLQIVRGGVNETRNLWYACSLISTAYSNAHDEVLMVEAGSRAVMEFYRPDDQTTAAASATLRLRHAGVQFGNPVVNVYLVNPPVPDMTTPIPGIASDYTLDAGIHSNPNVAASLRVTDSAVMADLIDTAYTGTGKQSSWSGGQSLNAKQESHFDPTLWGTPGVDHLSGVANPSPAQLATLMPSRVNDSGATKGIGLAGKSTIYGDTLRVVNSTELAQRGLPALAPGLGALEMIYPSMRIQPGQGHPQSWTMGGEKADNLVGPDLELCFKREHIGRVVDGYMRMHVMLAEGWDTDDSSMAIHWHTTADGQWGKWPEQAGQEPQAVTWRTTDFSGKFPGGFQQITDNVAAQRYVYPTRMNGGNVDLSVVTETPGNGYSSSSGVYGYQGRWQFKQGFYKQNFEGPACGGAVIALETYDFSQNAWCIPSQSFIGGWDLENYAGLGLGHLQPKKWYCVEMRWKINTITQPYTEAPVGTHYLESGFVQDGFLEWWVDGVKASKSPFFATRNGRIVDWALQGAQGRPFGTANSMRPMSEVPADVYMGATAAILQCYYGGRSALMKDMKVLLNGIVVSNGAYIGPMKGISRDNGGIP